CEDLAKLKVDPADCPMEIDLVVQIQARVEEHEQRLRAVAVQSQTVLGDEGVVDDPLDVYRPDRDSADVGVAEDVVHVVGRVGANEERPENLQPGRGCESWEGLGRDQEGNPAWVDGLAGSEIRLRRSTQLCYQRGQLAEDEMAADHLVVDAPADEV